MICKGYSEGNNKFIKFNDLSKPLTYGYSMMKLFPIEIPYWVHPKSFNLGNYSGNGQKGCFLQGDLVYPEELHDLHNDYTSAPEK